MARSQNPTDQAPDSEAEARPRFTVGVEIPIAVPPIRVWKALLEPDDMTHWFCEHAEVDRRPQGQFEFGGRYTYRRGEGRVGDRVLLGYETGRSVSYGWEIDGVETHVRYLLSGIRGDCRLRVIQQCSGPPHRDWRGELADHFPWENYLLNLKMYLERGDAGIRVDYDAIPESRHSIRGEVRCASERIWRVLTDREECSRRFGAGVEFDPSAGEGWTEPFGRVEANPIVIGRRLSHRWDDGRGGIVNMEWELLSKGVSSTVVLNTWGEGSAEEWYTGSAALWTHLAWCRAFNQLKYYSETGQLTGLRRLAADF